MKMQEIFQIVKFALWLIPELLKLISKAREVWPKKPGESKEQAEERRAARRRFVDPRIATKLRYAVGRAPTPAEVEATRELVYSAEKHIRHKRAGKTSVS